ncbi:hypothetical protein [Lysobacter capsici]|uniref:hypothetical protein n=1 Tax=Lysobacter capsici TaxID=435897 RepID=UPI001C0060F6|nr:hypothetical protein [Lysobacter capsici]QWF18237.1 hypothetical protein KME82_05575 [Lysobacter capsici]
MDRRITLLGCMLLAPLSANAADDYLCTPEPAYATVVGSEGFSGKPPDGKSRIYLMSKVRGKWIVRDHKTKQTLYKDCSSQYFCANTDGDGGVFIHDPIKQEFSATWQLENEKAGTFVSYLTGGPCKEIK